MATEPTDLNEALLDTDDSEDLENYFSDKKEGDFIELRIMGTLSETNGTHRRLSITEVILPETFTSVRKPEIDEGEDVDAALGALDEE